MNPFQPLPPDAAGQRNFLTQQQAIDAAKRHGAKSWAILVWNREFAWITPLDIVIARLPGAMMRGIGLAEMCKG